MLKLIVNALTWSQRLAFGGGGGSGSNVTEWKPLDELRPYHPAIVEQQAALSSRPYTPYEGERFADLNSVQQQGLQYMLDLTANSSPDVNAARNVTMNTLAGNYANPYAMAQTRVAQNEYLPMDNPYLRSAIQSGQSDLADSYLKATAPSRDAMFAMQRDFGGSAHQQRITDDQNQLLKGMQAVEQQYGLPAYMQSTQLAESAIDRGLQAQTGDINRATGAYEAERARQMSAIPQALANYQNELGAAKAMTSVGDVYQQQQQQMLNEAFNEFSRAQAYPQEQLDAMLNSLIRASGGFGTQTATQTQNTQINPASALLGAGMLGYGLYNM